MTDQGTGDSQDTKIRAKQTITLVLSVIILIFFLVIHVVAVGTFFLNRVSMNTAKTELDNAAERVAGANNDTLVALKEKWRGKKEAYDDALKPVVQFNALAANFGSAVTLVTAVAAAYFGLKLKPAIMANKLNNAEIVRGIYCLSYLIIGFAAWILSVIFTVENPGHFPTALTTLGSVAWGLIITIVTRWLIDDPE